MTRPCATVLVFVLAAFGCEKTNDLPRLQAEAQAMQHQLADHLDELARRATEIGERGNRVRAERASAAEVQRVYRRALTVVEDHRRELQQLPELIQAELARGGIDDLHRLLASVRQRSDRAVTEATSALAAVESWIANAERAGQSRGADEPAPGPLQPETDASGAPIR